LNTFLLLAIVPIILVGLVARWQRVVVLRSILWRRRIVRRRRRHPARAIEGLLALLSAAARVAAVSKQGQSANPQRCDKEPALQ
jgi:uncharacterized iron-regulated membrane protein